MLLNKREWFMPSNFRHGLVLGEDGTHYFAIGYNDSSQLGIEKKDKISTFTRIDVKVPFIAICAGYSFHSLAIAVDGSLWAWGTGFLGIEDSKERMEISHPTQIPNTSNFIQIAAGEHFSLALDQNGFLWSWGMDYQYDNHEIIAIPTLHSLKDIKMISAGIDFGAALNSQGELWIFGNMFPLQQTSISSGKLISSGYYHTLVLDNSMNLWDVSTMNSAGLVTVNIPHSLNQIVYITCGGYSSFVYDCDGSIWFRGNNNYNELANGCAENAVIKTLTEAKDWFDCFIIPGGDHNIVINPEGYATLFGALGGYRDSLPKPKNVGHRPRFPINTISQIKSAKKAL